MNKAKHCSLMKALKLESDIFEESSPQYKNEIQEWEMGKSFSSQDYIMVMDEVLNE